MNIDKLKSIRSFKDIKILIPFVRYLMLIVLFIYMYMFEGVIFYISSLAFLALFYTWERQLNIRSGIGLIFFILLMFQTNVLFESYASGYILPAFWFFTASFVLLFVFLALFTGRRPKRIFQGIRKRPLGVMVLNTVIVLSLGIAAWYLLEMKFHFTSVMLYFLSFIIMFFVFGKKENTAVPGVALTNIKAAGNTPVQNIFRVMGVIIIAVIALRIYNGVYNYGVKEPVMLFFAGVMLAAYLFYSKDIRLSLNISNERFGIFDFIFVFLLLGAALYLRLINLDYLGMWYDDSLMIIEASGSKVNRLFNQSPASYGPLMSVWIIQVFMVYLTGGEVNLITVRLLSVISGSVGVVFIYFITFELFKRRTAMIAGIIAAVFFVYLLYARQGVSVIISSSIAVIGLYFFVRALKTGGRINWIIAGIITALGFYFYNASRFVILIPVIFAFIYILFNREKKKTFMEMLPGFILMAMAFFVVMYPLFEFMMNNPGVYWGRVSSVSGVSGFVPDLSFVKFLTENIARAARSMFTPDSSTWSIFSIPTASLVNGFCGFWFFIGLIFLCGSWIRWNNLLVLLWLGIGIAPTVFANPTTGDFTARMIVAVPAVIIIIAFGINELLSLLEKSIGKPMRLVSPLIIIVILAAVSFLDLNKYYNRYLNDPAVKLRYQNVYRQFADYASEFKDARILGSVFFKNSFYKYIFAMKKMKSEDINTSKIEFEKIYGIGERDVIIASEPRFDNFLGIYKEYFPNAEIKKHYNYEHWFYTGAQGYKKLYGWNEPQEVINFWIRGKRMTGLDLDKFSKKHIGLISIFIPKEDIRELYGLNYVFYKGTLEIGNIKAGSSIAVSALDVDVVEAYGAVYAPAAGFYEFAVNGGAIKELWINGRKQGRKNIYLFEGANKIKMRIGSLFDEKVEVLWKTPKKDFEKVSVGCLLSKTTDYGLIRTTDYGASRYVSRVYSVVNRNYWFDAEPGARSPGHTIKRTWTGKIDIESEEEYSFTVEGGCRAVVFVGGDKVFETDGKIKSRKEVLLNTGRHNLTVEVYGCMDEHWHSTLFFAMKQKGEREFKEIPYSKLKMDVFK